MAENRIQLARPAINFYGISGEKGQLRKWIENDHDTSQLVVSWPEIDTSFGKSFEDVSIAVAQRYPLVQLQSIKSMVHDIYSSERIDIHDGVFRINQENHVQVGWVSNKEKPESNEVKLSIEWVAEFKDDTIEKLIINSSSQFQKLKPSIIKKIEKQVPQVMARAYNLMPETDRKFLEMETISQYEQIKSHNELLDDPKEDSGGLITLFYGTNRNILKNRDDIDFGEKEIDEISYGTCTVRVPFGHKKGELERPGRFFIWDLPENQNIHITLQNCEVMDARSFKEMFKLELHNKTKKHGLLFVHGYRTTFKEAAYRTAQLAWDLPFSGFSGFFSWPSHGKLLKYSTDEAAARSSVLMLKNFITDLLAIEELEQLHIIAHSMGGLVLTLSLKEIILDLPNVAYLDKIFQLILGAPDIDKKEFKDVIMPSFNKLGKRRTIYASDHDLAMHVSSFKRTNRERLGQAIDGIFVDQGIDSIEASNIRSVNNHSYIFESDKVLSDLHYLISQNLSPIERRLREVKSLPVNYWLFPK